jgi:hypothetical protein
MSTRCILLKIGNSWKKMKDISEVAPGETYRILRSSHELEEKYGREYWAKQFPPIPECEKFVTNEFGVYEFVKERQ